jgi:uncharacterized protein YdhG (YjbR/CyaY superfamily)/predicted GIY-YIG superfamily endonuclease
MMFYTYILECADGSFYTGWTDDIEKRLHAHNIGSGSKYTRTRLPVVLKYNETYGTKSEAMRRECAIKKLTRSQKSALIQNGDADTGGDTVNQTQEVKTIDEYIATFPADIQEKLVSIRQIIRQTVPDATEKISYGMPTFYLHKNLVHFAAQKKHIGFYPAPSGVEAFADELREYKTSKGAVQFPLDKPLPLDLIARIALFRAEENRKLK